MEKEELKNFSIINNRGIDSPLNACCDNIIDKNGNIIYKNYNNLYKLTYKHVYKYNRITCISTDTIYDNDNNAYTPLYHYYYSNNGLNANNIKIDNEEDENDETEQNFENEQSGDICDKNIDEYIDERIYNMKSTKQKCLKYNL